MHGWLGLAVRHCWWVRCWVARHTVNAVGSAVPRQCCSFWKRMTSLSRPKVLLLLRSWLRRCPLPLTSRQVYVPLTLPLPWLLPLLLCLRT